MNAHTRKIWRRSETLLLCAAAGALLAGCLAVPEIEPYGEAQIDPNSAAAREVARAAENPGEYPTFADIPEYPEDVRPAASWRVAVNLIKDDGRELLAAVAPATWSLSGTEAFAARAREESGYDPADVPTAAEMAESEAFARRMRERATPPPRPR